MKVTTSLRKMCKDCQKVKRKGKNYVICKSNPRHKQRQRFSTAAAQYRAEALAQGSQMPQVSQRFAAASKDFPARSVAVGPATSAAPVAVVAGRVGIAVAAGLVPVLY